MLFVDSADKAARFIWLCDAFNVPAAVPGRRARLHDRHPGRAQGIIRHGAKMITAVAEATVPKISVIVRKAYGAGLYAMGGPAFEPDACLALPTARIAVMGPEAAVNAVYANRIAAIDDPDEREAFVAGSAAGVRGGRRPLAARVRSRRRRGRAARGPPRGTDEAFCARGHEEPTVLRPPPRRAAGLIRATTGASSPCALCSKCGRPLEDDELVAAPATDPEPAIEGAETAVSGTDQPDRCPSCGEVVAPVPEDDEEVPVRPPWHFKVLVVGTVVYLGYRLYQGVGWLIHHA